MAITPPEERVWWNEPVERTEVLWVTIALIWALVMFFMMPYWHYAGEQNLSTEAYRVKADAYQAKVEAAAEKGKVREEGTTGIPVVRPPVGGDAYMLGRQYQWWPVLELKKGATYRLHLSSMDVQHGWSLLPENINIQVHPGYEMILKVTPTRSGQYGVLCNEYCGTGHHTMTGKIYVTDN